GAGGGSRADRSRAPEVGEGRARYLGPMASTELGLGPRWAGRQMAAGVGEGRARYRRARPLPTGTDGWAAVRTAWPLPPGSGRAALLVEGGDRPATRAVLIGQREPCSRRFDLEHRPRPGDDRVSGGFFADGGEAGDGETLISPGDLARASIEPTGSNVDLDWLDSNHCHSMLLPAGSRFGHCVRRRALGDGTSVRF